MSTDPPARLIEDIYDAVVDAARWPDVLEQVCNYVGGAAATIFCHDTAGTNAIHHHSWGVAPDYRRLYFTQYVRLNPLNARRAAIDLGEVSAAHQLLPLGELKRSQFYREWMQPQGFIDAVFANIDRKAERYASISIVRSAVHGPVDDTARARLRALVPHLRRAFRLDNAMTTSRAETAMLADTLATFTASVFLVEAEGRVVYANPPAQRMLEEASILDTTGGVLRIADPQAQFALRGAIAAAASGSASGRANALISWPERSRRAWLADVLPLTGKPGNDADERTHCAAAAVVVRKASMPTRGALAAVAHHYKLTATESRALEVIVEHGGGPIVARKLGISAGTAKTHIGRLFEKTGARRQAELVKLVAAYTSPFSR